MSARLDFSALAGALSGQAEAVVHHLLPTARRSGPRYLAGNVRGEPGESLSVPVSGQHLGTFKDFSTDEKGDLLKLWSLCRSVSIVEAAREAAAWLNWDAGTPLPAPRAPRPATPVQHPLRLASEVCALTGEQISVMSDAAMRLLARPDAVDGIARSRGWKPETIQNLAAAGFLGLSPDRRGTMRVAFIYDTALKLRLKPLSPTKPFTGKKFDVMFGGLWLWRASLLTMTWGHKVRSDIHTVFLTEGESDCISLLDAGLEDDGQTLVLAVPGAKNFKPEWAPLLAGKDVVVAFDDDEHGQTGAKKVAGILRPVARSVRSVDLQPLLAQ